MEQYPNDLLVCSTCRFQLQPEFRFCPNCGTAVILDEPEDTSASEGVQFEGLFESPGSSPEPDADEPDQEPDPSILETREHRTYDFQTSPDPTPPPPLQDSGHPTWGTAETTVPPERGNRTLWIILGIIAFIVLVCCCILPLALTIIANVDTTFQNEIRSSSAILPIMG